MITADEATRLVDACVEFFGDMSWKIRGPSTADALRFCKKHGITYPWLTARMFAWKKTVKHHGIPGKKWILSLKLRERLDKPAAERKILHAREGQEAQERQKPLFLATGVNAAFANGVNVAASTTKSKSKEAAPAVATATTVVKPVPDVVIAQSRPPVAAPPTVTRQNTAAFTTFAGWAHNSEQNLSACSGHPRKDARLEALLGKSLIACHRDANKAKLNNLASAVQTLEKTHQIFSTALQTLISVIQASVL